jgi:hypothetical protein
VFIYEIYPLIMIVFVYIEQYILSIKENMMCQLKIESEIKLIAILRDQPKAHYNIDCCAHNIIDSYYLCL